MEEIIIGFVVLFGAVIMVIGIAKYKKLLDYSKIISKKRKSNISFFIKMNLVMMIFFLCGYSFIGVFLIKKISIENLLIGLISFFGSLFVLSVIIVQIRLSKAVEDVNNMQSVKALINAIEARDTYTKGHSEHVAKLSSCICENLPLEYKKRIDKDMLNYAGYLHDIGKIGIPESILNKRGSLNEEEWKVIKQHPLVGKNIVNSIDQFSSISEWIYYHHERIDGKGYYGIKNENIPIESKIISVADCFSALVTDRAYRKGKTYKEAISIMKSTSGMQLDSDILEVFLKIDKKRIEECRPNLLKKNL